MNNSVFEFTRLGKCLNTIQSENGMMKTVTFRTFYWCDFNFQTAECAL